MASAMITILGKIPSGRGTTGWRVGMAKRRNSGKWLKITGLILDALIPIGIIIEIA